MKKQQFKQMLKITADKNKQEGNGSISRYDLARLISIKLEAVRDEDGGPPLHLRISDVDRVLKAATEIIQELALEHKVQITVPKFGKFVPRTHPGGLKVHTIGAGEVTTRPVTRITFKAFGNSKRYEG